MLLNNMLEKKSKKLNLNQPILSVRRYSSMKLNGRKIESGGPVKAAGAVPFQWEKTPGQPKENSDTRPPNEPKEESEAGCHYDEAFVDALDTLSRVESFLLENSRTEPQARELMIVEDGFLHAPSKSPRKQSPPVQRRRLGVKILYGDSIAKRYKEKEGSYDGSRSDQLHRYNCGLRPRFCIDTSVSLVKEMSKENKSSREENEKSTKHVVSGSNHRKTFRELLLADQGSPKEFLNCVASSSSSSSLPETTLGIARNQDPTETENIELEDERETSTNNVELSTRSTSLCYNSGKKYSDEFLVQPPLLKSPSDSWLRRTLPSMSTRNAPRHSYQQPSKTTTVPL